MEQVEAAAGVTERAPDGGAEAPEKRAWKLPLSMVTYKRKPGSRAALRGKGPLWPWALTRHNGSQKRPVHCQSRLGGYTGASGWRSPSQAAP